jgi:hypothetical protein
MITLTKVDDSIDSGHIYQLAGNQHIRFMKKSEGKLVYEGTTNEELISVLLHRLEILNNNFPCKDNMDAIASLGASLQHLQRRTKKRVEQGVEGQDLSHVE